MLDFWEKIVKIVLPRQRDFKGISDKGFDSQGNLNLGFKEQTLFPDLEYDQIDKTRGLEVTVVTSTTDNKQAKFLLTELGMPFKK
jgi:large subunit ribosomal protein L5